MKTFTTETAFGEMLNLTNGKIELGITYNLGFRISKICAFGGKNLCFFDEKLTQTRQMQSTKWLQLGGHRLWKSPEDDDCYLYDNIPSEYTLNENGAEFLSVTRGDGLQFGVKIEFLDDTSLKITHSATNVGAYPKKIALWGITALNVGGKVFLPFSAEDSGLLPNRNVVFWSYTSLNDKRLSLSDKGIEVSSAPKTKPLKIGIFSKSGKIVYSDKNIVFTKTIDLPTDSDYPDMNCNVECYTNDCIQEIETLSPLYEINPQETKYHSEIWSFEKK